MGSCGTCYSCKKELVSVTKAFEMGNPILICKECEEKFRRLEPHMNDVLDLKGKHKIVISKGE